MAKRVKLGWFIIVIGILVLTLSGCSGNDSGPSDSLSYNQGVKISRLETNVKTQLEQLGLVTSCLHYAPKGKDKLYQGCVNRKFSGLDPALVSLNRTLAKAEPSVQGPCKVAIRHFESLLSDFRLTLAEIHHSAYNLNDRLPRASIKKYGLERNRINWISARFASRCA